MERSVSEIETMTDKESEQKVAKFNKTTKEYKNNKETWVTDRHTHKPKTKLYITRSI